MPVPFHPHLLPGDTRAEREIKRDLSAAAITALGCLRQAAKKAWRDDKSQSEVTVAPGASLEKCGAFSTRCSLPIGSCNTRTLSHCQLCVQATHSFSHQPAGRLAAAAGPRVGPRGASRLARVGAMQLTAEESGRRRRADRQTGRQAGKQQSR